MNYKEYYHFIFIGHLVLALIIILNTVKLILKYYKTKDRSINISDKIDLFISILSGLGLAGGIFFQGVISDISSKYGEDFNKLLFLSILSFISFIVQLVYYIKLNEFKYKK